MPGSAPQIAGVSFASDPSGLTPDRVGGFFVGWPNPPDETTLIRMLTGSTFVELAIDDATGNLVGFVTAISDGVLAAYLPLLEVLPAFQRRGIGSELVRRMVSRLENLYMIDLLCDPDLIPFYARFGMNPACGAMMRNYHHQNGAPR